MSKFGDRIENDGASLFIKLKDGESINGILRGEFRRYTSHFVDNKSHECVFDDCEFCKSGSKPKHRFTTNFIVEDKDTYAAKLLTQGTQVCNQLIDLEEAGWDMDKTIVRISRKGSGQMDTKYTVTATPTALTEDQLSQVNDVVLNSVTPDEKSEVGDVVNN